MGRWIADRRRLKWALLIVMVLLAVSLATVFWGYRHTMQPAKILTDVINAGAQLSMDRIEHTAIRNGRVQWRLKARAASLEDKTQVLVLTEPEVVFYTDDGRSVHLTADKGRLNTETNDLEATGNVIIRDSEYRMRTQQLQYSHRENQLTADQPVSIDGAWASLTAETMVMDLTNRHATFTGKVEGVIREGIS